MKLIDARSLFRVSPSRTRRRDILVRELVGVLKQKIDRNYHHLAHLNYSNIDNEDNRFAKLWYLAKI